MRPIHLVILIAACSAFATGAYAQNNSRIQAAPEIHRQKPVAVRPVKPKEVAPADMPDGPIDMIQADQREEKFLNQKLNGICRGC